MMQHPMMPGPSFGSAISPMTDYRHARMFAEQFGGHPGQDMGGFEEQSLTSPLDGQPPPIAKLNEASQLDEDPTDRKLQELLGPLSIGAGGTSPAFSPTSTSSASAGPSLSAAASIAGTAAAVIGSAPSPLGASDPVIGGPRTGRMSPFGPPGLSAPAKISLKMSDTSHPDSPLQGQSVQVKTFASAAATPVGGGMPLRSPGAASAPVLGSPTGSPKPTASLLVVPKNLHPDVPCDK